MENTMKNTNLFGTGNSVNNKCFVFTFPFTSASIGSLSFPSLSWVIAIFSEFSLADMNQCAAISATAATRENNRAVPTDTAGLSPFVLIAEERIR